MSSLQSIMNADEDQHDASTSTPMDKRDKDAATPASGFRGQDPSTLSPSSHVIRSGQQPSSTYTTPPTPTVIADSNIARSGQQPTDTDKEPGSTSAAQKGKGRAGPSDSRNRTPAATTISTSSSRPEGSRRQSTASVDSMDQHGYGSASSSSMGGAGGGGLPPSHPTRPMGSPNPEVPIRLTPITGRVSRAKKGVPVHTCDMCNPPKTFTRAEHLRRHQLSHQTPRYPCTYPGCDRAFHRPDLLLRHQQRHEQEGDKASRSGGDDRRGSTASGTSTNLEERMPGLRVGGTLQAPPVFQSNPGGFAGPSASPSMSEMPQNPNIGNSHFTQGGSPASGGNANTATYSWQSGMPSMSSSPEPRAFPDLTYVTPRTMPFIDTPNLDHSAALQIDNPPELMPSAEYSPWTSASESNYSTPQSDINRSRRDYSPNRSHSSIGWQANTGILSGFHSNSHREVHGTNVNLETITAPQYATTHSYLSPHLAPAPFQAYGPLLDTSMMTSFHDGQTQHMLDPSITAVHHRSSSVRSLTPPPSSAQAADTLVTPAPLSNRIDPMAQVRRQKAMVMGGGNVNTAVTMIGGDGNSPSWPSNSPGGILTGSALGGCGIGGMTVVTPLPRSTRNAVPGYLEVYWKRFHPFYPIVHRESVEGAGADVLKCAMAALGTQYLNIKEDRTRGNQLHEYAWQEAKRCPPWDLQAMQAIVLCECFARHRGRKAVVRPSKLFESLYSRVLDQTPAMYTAALGHGNMDIQMTNEERWHTWLDAETRRRLLSVCFIVDNHASIYHQQPRARTDVDPSTIALTGPSDALWAARSADEWATTLSAHPAAGTPQFLPHPNTLTPEDVARHSYLDQVAILLAETIRLPRRHCGRPTGENKNGDDLDNSNDNSNNNNSDDLRTPTTASFGQNFRGIKPEDRIAHLFSQAATSISANVYLALHFTPLHDLLAVSGDSYVFCQKVVHAPTYLEHQKRLRAWAEGRASSFSSSSSAATNTGNTSTSPTSAQQGSSPVGANSPDGLLSPAKATMHAAKALVGFLYRGPDPEAGVTPFVTCVSNYWGMYVCALIIWAFGRHRAPAGAARASTSSSSSSGNGNGNGNGGGSNSSSPNKGGPMGEEDTIAWLRQVSEVSAPEQLARMRGRREASAGVVSMVRRRLEADCVGPRSQLYVDAVGVLKKLEEGVNWRWF